MRENTAKSSFSGDVPEGHFMDNQFPPISLTWNRAPAFPALILLVMAILCWSEAKAAAPGAFNVTSPGETTAPGPLYTVNEIKFQWDAAPGALSYELYVRDLDTDFLSTYKVASTSKTLKLYPGTPYKWNVGAYSGANQSGSYKQSSNSRWLSVGISDLYFRGGVSLSPETVSPGDDVEVSFRVRNKGSGNSLPTQVRIQITKPDGSILAQNDDSDLPSIGPGDDEDLDATLTIPAGTATGAYGIKLEIDAASHVNVDSDNDNNTYSETGILTIGKQYSIELLPAVGGEILLDPPLDRYPPDTLVTVSVIPEAGRFLAHLTHDVGGRAKNTAFRINANMTIGAIFDFLEPLISFGISKEENGVATLPPQKSFKYLIQNSTDLVTWHDEAVLNATESVKLNFTPGEPLVYISKFRRAVLVPEVALPFLGFPIDGLNTSTAVVTAVLDHHVENGVGKRDGSIKTCRGDVITIDETNGRAVIRGTKTVVSVKRNDLDNTEMYETFHYILPKGQSMFQLPFAYDDDNKDSEDRWRVWYDGHTGYDFSVANSNSKIVAAADGTLNTQQSTNCYKTICIDHVNGYRTYYLHSKREGFIEEAIQSNTAITIKKGDQIGTASGWGCSSSTNYAVHLHFIVMRPTGDGEQYAIVDPWGMALSHNGPEYQASLWLPESDQ